MALMPVAVAKDRILEGAVPLEAELAPVTAAGGRVLAQDIAARLTQPPFHASAMDGYAVRAADIAQTPAVLTVIGEAAAGHAFGGSVGAGQASRIFTGAPLPDGADTVIMQENTRVTGPGAVEILESAPAGRHVRRRGHDFSEGEILLRAGQVLRSRELMLAAGMNHAALPVRRKPLVAVLATGDELVSPGGAPAPDQVISSIPAGLKAALTAWGADVRLLGIARDTKESLAAFIGQASAADILLTIGGASVGEHDLVRGALEDAGARFEFLKVAMRPGKPLMFGYKWPQRVLSLPGNPISAIICARVFLKPLLNRLRGLNEPDVPLQIPLCAPLEANGEREYYMRGAVSNGAVAPLSDQDSSLMKAFASADCLIVRPAFGPALGAGDPVPVIPLDF